MLNKLVLPPAINSAAGPGQCDESSKGVCSRRLTFPTTLAPHLHACVYNENIDASSCCCVLILAQDVVVAANAGETPVL